MRIVIAGGHGKIALLLERRAAARGDATVALIRDPAQSDDVRAAGAEPVVADLEALDAGELAGHLTGADAVVFAAGAGPGSTAERKGTVDRDAAVLLADAAAAAGVRRYLLVSAMNIDSPPGPEDDDSVWAHYLRAKKAAEDALRARDDLDLTILRPGRLTDEPGTGLVRLGPVGGQPPVGYGEVSRDDVAAVLLALLDAPASAGAVLDLVGGTVPPAQAVAALTGANAPR
ncbi:NAD(P)H-binding protein [Actinomycetospora cinnamomea]|uniref:Nucleoside-diphosphate-sugar epimerase n=1 Tax=Actinomycetospora cinnamomea TaxID=663609 RepID=A0A2U1FBT0_9PSEU|nr:NAD(P)H-binding protein [Actinomycetospora cinnamomea]PVZ09653.1 nucleoside-diphosphate-sugar epimerase [Actinomycetospora cinnamomea]